MWQVLPGLFLGDREDSRDRANLLRHGVTHVVNCAAELPCCHPDAFAYLALGLRDPDSAFAARAREAMGFIDRGRAAGGVLVHCTAGVSRSAAVVLRYLCHLGRPLDRACAELSAAVLTGVDESFLRQIGEELGVALSKAEIRAMSMTLAGRGEGG